MQIIAVAVPEQLLAYSADHLRNALSRDRISHASRLTSVVVANTAHRTIPAPAAMAAQRAGPKWASIVGPRATKTKISDTTASANSTLIANAPMPALRQWITAKVRHLIVFAMARTSEGMMAKVRVMILHFPDDPSWVEQRLEEAVAASGGGDCARKFVMSLALDAMGMDGRASPACKPRSIAA